MQTAKHVSWARVGPRPPFVVRSVRVWARMQAEQEGRHVYDRPNDFVRRFMFSCQWTYDTSRNTCSMSRVGYWNEVKRLICYLHIITTPFQPSVMSSTSIASF